jgi:hypothetical protein
MMTRRIYVAVGAVAALTLSTLTLTVVLDDAIVVGSLTSEQLDLALIAGWLLIPPLFFWVDWVWFCRYLPHDSPERRTISHTHSLSRNIWAAFVALLILLFCLQQLIWQAQADNDEGTGVSQQLS